MKHKKRFKILGIIFTSIFAFMASGYCYFYSTFPDVYYTCDETGHNFAVPPLSINIGECRSCINSGSGSFSEQVYAATLMFLDFLPIKTVKVNAVPKKEVIPCGTPFGVRVYTDGVMIIDISDVKTTEGDVSPAKKSGLCSGDFITKVNENSILTNEELESIVKASGGAEMHISAVRNNTPFETSLTPAKSREDQSYHAGIWVRDSSAGIGTLTFYDKDNLSFSGLGHGICDVDTGQILRLSHGDIMEAAISDVKKSSDGYPGELKGCFIDPTPMGKLCANTDSGIYGVLEKPPVENEAVPLAMKQNVKKGAAKILTTVDGTKPEYYDINIDTINYNVGCPTKNMRISITDEKLLSKTGGIVQGMSGSPIIQEGCLVGAVTHVLVNEPAKGYGIFAETMMTNSNKFFGCQYKKSG